MPKRLIELYRSQTELMTKEALAFRPVSPMDRFTTELSLEQAVVGLRISQKYMFSTSAELFHKELLYQRLGIGVQGNVNPEEKWKLKFPSLPIWIELETGLNTLIPAQGFFINHHYHPEVVRRLKHPGLDRMPGLRQQMLEQVIEEQRSWFIDVISPAGTIIFHFEANAKGEPAIGPGHVCPWNECTFPNICEDCKAQVIFFGFWLVIALLMVEGNFATSAEAEPGVFPEQIETVRRQLPAQPGGNPKKQKKKHVEEQQVWHLVMFDACLKKPQQPAVAGVAPDDLAPEVDGKQSATRGSWLQAAIEIDPDAVIYLDRQIAPYDRTLRSPYFKHKQGQTVKTGAYPKRIPVKVRDLGGKITRVVASGYSAATSSKEKEHVSG